MVRPASDSSVGIGTWLYRVSGGPGLNPGLVGHHFSHSLTSGIMPTTWIDKWKNPGSWSFKGKIIWKGGGRVYVKVRPVWLSAPDIWWTTGIMVWFVILPSYYSYYSLYKNIYIYIWRVGYICLPPFHSCKTIKIQKLMVLQVKKPSKIWSRVQKFRLWCVNVCSLTKIFNAITTGM